MDVIFKPTKTEILKDAVTAILLFAGALANIYVWFLFF